MGPSSQVAVLHTIFAEGDVFAGRCSGGYLGDCVIGRDRRSALGPQWCALYSATGAVHPQRRSVTRRKQKIPTASTEFNE
jgi:hypothetical protein